MCVIIFVKPVYKSHVRRRLWYTIYIHIYIHYIFYTFIYIYIILCAHIYIQLFAYYTRRVYYSIIIYAHIIILRFFALCLFSTPSIDIGIFYFTVYASRMYTYYIVYYYNSTGTPSQNASLMSSVCDFPENATCHARELWLSSELCGKIRRIPKSNSTRRCTTIFNRYTEKKNNKCVPYRYHSTLYTLHACILQIILFSLSPLTIMGITYPSLPTRAHTYK